MKLLFCDDDPDQIHWLEKSFLSVDGYDVYSACNADEAWELYQAAQPDVVVTDYQCGGNKLRDGIELIQAIRSVNPNQRCIIQTSKRQKLIDGIPQLHKPFLLRSLQRILRLPVQPLLF